MGRRRRRSRRRSSRIRGILLLLALVGLAWWLESGGVLAKREVSRGEADDPSDDAKPYRRRDWPHWSDADRDCQDTRQEVLIAESEIPVRFRGKSSCSVAAGRWRCPYTGKVITDPRKLDVDHLVPLHEAHRSGGDAWDREQREQYANELSDPTHLVAVDRSANRTKGDKAPHLWMPEAPEYRCEYVRTWIDVKARWDLSISAPEQAYLDQAQHACDEGEVPPLPSS